MTGQPPAPRDALGDYLNLRRALGFRLANAGRLLGQFVSYLEARGADTVTAEHALAWATQPAGASVHWQAIRLSVVRGFAAYLHSLDPAAEIIPAGQFRAGPCRATPYLYSDAEIGSLIKAAAALRPGLRAATYQTLIGLLAVSGVRVGEAIGLDEADFDAGRELLVIRNAKYGKHRLVPLHPSIGLTFAGLAERARLTRRSASCRPRVHDLRHSFAVATVLGWYRDGADIPALMPRLSTYLGHTDPQHTFWYYSDFRVIPIPVPLRA